MDSIVCENLSVQFDTNFSHIPYNGVIWKDLNYLDYMKLIIYAVVIIGGIFGNTSVILTVALNKYMRTTINLYVANLAVTDAMICIVCMLPNALKVLTNLHILGELMCKLNPFAQMTCLICSVLTLSAISCDRFIAVMFPLHVRVTKQRTPVVIAIVWIISAVVSIPFLFFKKYEVFMYQDFLEPRCNDRWPLYWYYDESLGSCLYHRPHRYIYYIVVILTLYFLPIFIMITSYSLILWRLWKSNVPGEQHEANVNIQSRARKKVHAMVFVVLIAFIICWTPFQVILLYALEHKQGRDGALPQWFTDFKWYAYFIAYSNSFINPIIYGGYNQTFREGFCLLLRCKCRREQFGQPGRTRLTFTTAFKSSSSQKTLNGSRKILQNPNAEMIPMHPAKDNDVPPVVKNTEV